MLHRLRRQQHPRRFSRPAADVLVLEAITFCSQANTITFPYQTGPRLHSRGNELPPHQKACETTNFKRLAGNHCTSSDNDLRLGRLDSSSDCPRANATANRPSPPSPYEGREPAIKAKEPEVRPQVALTVSLAEATASAVGSLTYGDRHLSTDDSSHLRANATPANGGRPSAHRQVLTPVLATGARTRPSKNTNTALVAYGVLCDPPVRSATREGPWTGPACARRDRRPCGGRTATPRPGSRWQFPSSIRLVNALLPRMLEEEAGRQPMRKAGLQLGSPPSPARMMNILEAKGKGQATARLALPHHKAGGHHPG
jgi:hypothetical protein